MLSLRAVSNEMQSFGDTHSYISALNTGPQILIHAAECYFLFSLFIYFFFCACLSKEKGFMFLVRGGVEGKMGRYNVPPHPQQC